ncbi:hypothetical protein HDU88_005409 [Geranomyces variabilis]|nr:hypothetical protein HDU88_005409 [Geranomyces variabilis]
MPKAFVLTGPNTWVVDEVQPPTAKDGQVVIKVHAAAANPLDAKMAKEGLMIRAYPARLGVDISGTISAIGSDVTAFKVGDAVFARPQMDGFAEYATATVRHTWKKPDNLSFEQAATIPVGTLTAVIGLFSEKGLKLTRPKDAAKPRTPEGKYILVWGGSSNRGYTVIATASPKQRDAVLALGAAHVVDYSAPDAVEQIRELTKGECRLALNAVGGDATVQAAAALRADEREPSTVVSVAATLGAMPAGVTLLPPIFGFDPTLVDFVHEMIGNELVEYFAKDEIKPSRVKVVKGGLDGVGEALELLAGKKVSGEKLVVVI